jgi:hypothetical protein
MLGHVARWESGGLTKRDYCTRASIDYNRFHYWYRVSKGLTRKAAEPSSSFLPVRLTPEAEPLPAIPEIVVTGASGLSIYHSPQGCFGPGSFTYLSILNELLEGGPALRTFKQ